MDFKAIWQDIRSKASQSLTGTGRSLEDITILAVTKTVPAEVVQQAVEAGFVHLGENRVQELAGKWDRIQGDVRWHLIGPLQRNKVKYIIQRVHLIQSLDSIKLAHELERQAAAVGRVIPALVQVNIGREQQKSGILPEALMSFLQEVAVLSHVRVCGLMAIPPYFPDAEAVRPYFRAMRQLYDASSEAHPAMAFKYLSMGMSHDYEAALQEGANMIRIGTGIFGSRKKEEP